MVPAATVDAYVAAAREAGDEVTLDRRPENGHFDLVEPGSGAWASVVAWLSRFA